MIIRIEENITKEPKKDVHVVEAKLKSFFFPSRILNHIHNKTTEIKKE